MKRRTNLLLKTAFHIILSVTVYNASVMSIKNKFQLKTNNLHKRSMLREVVVISLFDSQYVECRGHFSRNELTI